MSSTLEGYFVLDMQPDFAEAPRLAGKYSGELVDLSDAPRVNAYIGRKPAHVLNQKFKFHSRTEFEEFEDFFDSVAGTWLPFWVPSWHAELAPTADCLAGASTLSISPVKYATTYDPTALERNDLGHYIFLMNVQGNLEIKKVVSVAGTSPEVLTFDTPIVNNYKLGLSIVGFMYFVRFLSDQLSIDFTGLAQGDCEVGYMEVQEMGSGAPGGDSFNRITDTGARRVTNTGSVRTIFH